MKSSKSQIMLISRSELTQIVADVVHDPTLPKTTDHPCPRCGNRLAVFFQAQTRRAEVSLSYSPFLPGRDETLLRMHGSGLRASLDGVS